MRGSVQGVIGATMGGLIFGFWSSLLGTIVLCIAGVITLCAVLSPTGAYAAIDRGFLALGRGVGRLLSWLMLPLIFFLLFAPFGILFRRGRRDAMKRYYDPGAPSYWSDRSSGVVASASRRRQF